MKPTIFVLLLSATTLGSFSVAADSTDKCSLPKAAGPCKALMKKFFHDSASGECKTFFYGGCQGNENKFDTKEACEQACKK